MKDRLQSTVDCVLSFSVSLLAVGFYLKMEDTGSGHLVKRFESELRKRIPMARRGEPDHLVGWWFFSPIMHLPISSASDRIGWRLGCSNSLAGYQPT